MTAAREPMPDPIRRQAAGARKATRQILLSGGYQVSVEVGDGWLALTTSLPAGDSYSADRLLVLNRSLGAGARFCLDRWGAPVVRLELPLRGDDDDGEDRLLPALAHLQSALAALAGAADTKSSTPQNAGDAAAAAAGSPGKTAPERGDIPPVKEACDAAGWPCIERSPMRWAVDLEGTSEYAQAEIAAEGDSIRLDVTLAQWPEQIDESTSAAARFLLIAGGASRMVAPAIDERGSGRHTVVLQARIGTADVRHDLHHALCALSVAAAHTQREVRALIDETDVAGCYLAMSSGEAGAS